MHNKTKKSLAYRILSVILSFGLMFSGIPIVSINDMVSAEEVTASGNWTDEGNYSTAFAGSGSETDPYLITNAAELAGLAVLINDTSTNSTYASAYYKITAETIDLSAHYWTPIGSGASADQYFKGTFDGNNKSITGLKVVISASSLTYGGLFGYVSGGTINNVHIDSGSVQVSTTSGDAYAGGIAGNVVNSSITACYNKANVSSSSSRSDYAGGIAG